MDFVPYYPAFLSLRTRLAVVIGGDEAAERKVRQLLKYGPDVLVVSPEVTTGLEALEEACEITVERRGYVRGDLQNAALVLCLGQDQEVERAVYAEAEERGCLVNVADDPALCNYLVPSVIHRGPFQIAISTAGAAPAVARRVRKQLSAEFGEEWTPYVLLLGQLRALVVQRIPDADERKRLFEAVADSDLLERVRAGKAPDAEDLYAEAMVLASKAAIEE